MTKIKNDPSKANLIVVKSELNDKNSESYLKKIKRIWREEYSDDINLIEIPEPIKTQKEFDKILKQQRGSVLCLDPHPFVFKLNNQHRNAEKNQIVDALMFALDTTRFNRRILIIGTGDIGTELHDRLLAKKRIVMATSKDNVDQLDREFLNCFDILVNATRYDFNLNLFFTKDVFDVSGSFKPLSIIDEREGITYTEKCTPFIVTRGEIGTNTTRLMLNEVIENGL